MLLCKNLSPSLSLSLCFVRAYMCARACVLHNLCYIYRDTRLKLAFTTLWVAWKIFTPRYWCVCFFVPRSHQNSWSDLAENWYIIGQLLACLLWMQCQENTVSYGHCCREFDKSLEFQFICHLKRGSSTAWYDKTSGLSFFRLQVFVTLHTY